MSVLVALSEHPSLGLAPPADRLAYAFDTREPL
jgi:hypothetical protein